MEPSDQTKRQGVLCIPFSNSKRETSATTGLVKLKDWIIEAGLVASVNVAPIEGSFNSSEEIISRIYRSIREADIVISVVREANPNVFFESGYAIGQGKPILYIVREGERVPFDIQGVEYFKYVKLDDNSKLDLAVAMERCMTARSKRLSESPDFSSLREHLSKTEFASDLYGECVSYAFRNISRSICNWKGENGFVSEGASDILRVGNVILEHLALGGFATQYYAGQKSWREEGDVPYQYFDSSREAARRGRDIVRVYVVDDIAQTNEGGFRSLVWSDVEAGVKVKCILRKQLPDPQSRDFGLWDNQLYCEIEYSGSAKETPRLHRCHYATDSMHIERAKEWQKIIENKARPCIDFPPEDELLRLSAPMLGTDKYLPYCKLKKPWKGDCSPYHLAWQRLRLCRMVSTPSWHADFYSNAFQHWSRRAGKQERNRKFKVLISGLADYAMLYWTAGWIPHSIRQRTVFSVLDICESPLQSCVWLRRHLHALKPSLVLEVVPVQSDIFKNRFTDREFDLIVSDAFLTRFQPADEKEHLVKEWLRLLRPGGRLVTTARVQERPGDIQVADRSEFVKRAVENAENAGQDVDQIKRDARAYSQFITSYPFKGESDLRKFLDKFENQAVVHQWKPVPVTEFEMTEAVYSRISLIKKG